MAASKFRPMATYRAAGAIGNFIANSNTLVYMLQHGTYFTAPPVTYITANALIANLQVAETLARTGVTGSAAARDLVYQGVLTNNRNFMIYVQTLADAAGSKTQAIAIISASGFGLKVEGIRIKAPLTAELTLVSGQVSLNSKAPKMRALYNWQTGIEVSGIIIWTNLPNTLKSKVKLNSLPLGVRTFFRNRTLTKNGLSGWSVAVTIIPQ